MVLLAVEGLEGIVELIAAFLQLLDKQILIILLLMRDLNHVEVLQTIVITVDIILVGTLADVEHAHICAVDVEHSCMTSLPVEIDVASHGALDNQIAEVHVAEIVTAIAE